MLEAGCSERRVPHLARSGGDHETYCLYSRPPHTHTHTHDGSLPPPPAGEFGNANIKGSAGRRATSEVNRSRYSRFLPVFVGGNRDIQSPLESRRHLIWSKVKAVTPQHTEQYPQTVLLKHWRGVSETVVFNIRLRVRRGTAEMFVFSKRNSRGSLFRLDPVTQFLTHLSWCLIEFHWFTPPWCWLGQVSADPAEK